MAVVCSSVTASARKKAMARLGVEYEAAPTNPLPFQPAAPAATEVRQVLQRVVEVGPARMAGTGSTRAPDAGPLTSRYVSVALVRDGPLASRS